MGALILLQHLRIFLGKNMKWMSYDYHHKS